MAANEPGTAMHAQLIEFAPPHGPLPEATAVVITLSERAIPKELGDSQPNAAGPSRVAGAHTPRRGRQPERQFPFA